MSQIQDKNLFFYSVHPNDQYSYEFRQELEKIPQIKNQFVMICVNDPSLRIPNNIRNLGKIPVLIASGFDRPIMGQDAVSWLKNRGKSNGFEYGSLKEDNDTYAYISDDSQKSDYNQFYNSEYNLGFGDKDAVINSQFTKLGVNSHITTFDNSNQLHKSNIMSQIEKRLSNLKVQRRKENPDSLKRKQEEQRQRDMRNQDFTNGQRPGNGSGLAYNPNPYGQHQLPFQMPSMPRMNPYMTTAVPGSRGPAIPTHSYQNQQQNQTQIRIPTYQPSGPSLPFNMGMNNNGAPNLPFGMRMPHQNMHFKNPNI